MKPSPCSPPSSIVPHPEGRDLPRRSALLLAALTIARPARAASCRAEAMASVPLSAALGLWTVPAMIDDKPATFVLDTGAERTVLSDTAVRRLGLKRDEWVSTVLRGVGGVEWRANATARSLTLGGIALRRPIGPPTHSLGVASLPFFDRGAEPVDGLLGADYLAAFDLDIDPVARTLTLQAMQGCAELGAVPWPVPYAALPAQRPRRGLLLVPVVVNGVVMMAQLDTGSSVTLLSRRGLARLGAQGAGRSEQSATGVGPQALALSRYRVATLQLGPIVLRDVDLAAGAPAGGFALDMVLGLDTLRQRRIWVSYATNQLLIATR